MFSCEMKKADGDGDETTAPPNLNPNPNPNPNPSRNPSTKRACNFIGRHRLQAAISHLDQQIQMFQDELDELDSVDGPSTVCNELISGVESTPDPLLPVTKGPVDVRWERWFGGNTSSRTHRRWI